MLMVKVYVLLYSIKMTVNAEVSQYPIPALDDIIDEQERLQRHKRTDRGFAEYSDALFPTDLSAVEHIKMKRILGGFSAQATIRDLGGLLDAFIERSDGEFRPHWVDLGGGNMIAQREMTRRGGVRGCMVKTTNVDVCRFPLAPGSSDNERYLPAMAPPIHRREFPNIIEADAANAVFGGPADIVTSVFSIMYMHDPLGVMANAYNQTRAGGLVMISTADSSTYYDWTKGLHDIVPDTTTPMARFFHTLKHEDIPFAAIGCKERDEDGCATYATLIIQRVAGTVLSQRANVADVRFGDSRDLRVEGYKQVYYSSDTTESPIVVQKTEKYS